MKKVALLMASAFLASGAFAQDLTSKKGEPILPEANDWAISFDAVPFMNYAGNLFSGNTVMNNSPGANWVDPGTMTITGKMFKDEKTAYRVTIRLGMNSMKTTAKIADANVVVPPVYPQLPPMKEDEWKNASHFYGIGGGLEMRRGKTRLQGFYGGELMFWTSGEKNTFSYGNALSAAGILVNPDANTTTDFGASSTSTGPNLTGVSDTYGNPARIKEDKPGSMMGLGVRGFIGAEYFLMPKISIGAEYGWGVGLSSTGTGEQTLESVGGSPSAVGSQTIETGKSSGFGLDTDINGGTGSGTTQLKITFHF